MGCRGGTGVIERLKGLIGWMRTWAGLVGRAVMERIMGGRMGGFGRKGGHGEDNGREDSGDVEGRERCDRRVDGRGAVGWKMGAIARGWTGDGRWRGVKGWWTGAIGRWGGSKREDGG